MPIEFGARAPGLGNSDSGASRALHPVLLGELEGVFETERYDLFPTFHPVHLAELERVIEAKRNDTISALHPFTRGLTGAKEMRLASRRTCRPPVCTDELPGRNTELVLPLSLDKFSRSDHIRFYEYESRRPLWRLRQSDASADSESPAGGEGSLRL
jgi:hypothetical protein